MNNSLSKSSHSPKLILPYLNTARPTPLSIINTPLTDRKGYHSSKLPEHGSPKLSSPGFLTTRNNLDEQTTGNIKKIIDDRHREIIRENQKKLRVLKKGEPINRVEKDLETITKIKKFMQNKGLSGKRKKKLQFDKKFDIFDSVKTFVDARKLFQNTPDSIMSPQARSSPQGRTSPTGSETKNIVPELNLLMTNKNLEATFDTVMTEFKDSDGSFTKSNPDDEPDELKSVLKFQADVLNYADGDLYPDEDFLTPIAKPKKKKKAIPPPTHKRTISAEEMKILKIRRLYQDLKTRTIEKLGSNIFENIQHKLQDPDIIKEIEQKRLRQLTINRLAQRELKDFELGENIIDHLKNNKQNLRINLQAENYSTSNQFEKFLDKELLAQKDPTEQYAWEYNTPENYEDLVLPFIDTIQEEDFLQILDEERNQTWEQRMEKDQDPQIKMLLKARQFKEKTTAVVHALKHQIYEAYGAEEHEESSPMMRQKDRSPSHGRFSRMIIPGSPFSRQRNSHMASIQLVSGKNSPELGDKTTRVKKLSLLPSFSPTNINIDAAKRLSMQPIMEATALRKKKGLSVEPGTHSSVFTTSLPQVDDYQGPRRGVSPRHQSRNLSNISSSRNLDNESKIISSGKHKKKVDDFYNQLDDLSNFTKDINSNMKSKLRKMEDPLGHHVKALRRLEIPECLQVVPNIGYIRSTAKLASNLARQTLKISKQNDEMV